MSSMNLGPTGNAVLRAILFAVVLLLSGCIPSSDVVGSLAIGLGVPGDVRQCVVRLHENQSDSARYVQRPLAGGKRDRVRFKFTDIRTGEYYLVAWQDINADGIVNDGDLTGVYGGDYEHKDWGVKLKVEPGTIVNVGDIWLHILREPVKTAMGTLDSSGKQTDFSFVFYHDLTLGSLTVTFPGFGSYIDPQASGPKLAGRTYYSRGWEFGGKQMPTGEHRLVFAGTMDSREFEVEFIVNVQ